MQPGEAATSSQQHSKQHTLGLSGAWLLLYLYSSPTLQDILLLWLLEKVPQVARGTHTPELHLASSSAGLLFECCWRKVIPWYLGIRNSRWDAGCNVSLQISRPCWIGCYGICKNIIIYNIYNLSGISHDAKIKFFKIISALCKKVNK